MTEFLLEPLERALFATAEEAAEMTQRPVSLFERAIAEQRGPVLVAALEPDVPPVPLLPITLVRKLAEQVPPKRRAKPDAGVRMVMQAREWLRDYLDEVPPVATYDAAVTASAPYVARAGSRWGAPHAHVQLRFVLAFLRARGVRPGTSARLEPQ